MCRLGHVLYFHIDFKNITYFYDPEESLVCVAGARVFFTVVIPRMYEARSSDNGPVMPARKSYSL